MPLVIPLQITRGPGLELIETLRISRITALKWQKHDDEVHQYVAQRFSPEGEIREMATFTHRYGDGAWVCTLLALQALKDAG